MTKTLSWTDFRAAMADHGIRIDDDDAMWWMLWDEGISVNDAVVKQSYWDACRRADRNY